MSALGSILAAVEEKVMGLLAGVTSGEDEQNQRLSALEDRVTALEGKFAAKPSPTVAAKARTASTK